MKRVFQTTDNQVFDNARAARKHQTMLNAEIAVHNLFESCVMESDDARKDAAAIVCERAKEFLPHIVRLAGE